MSTNGKQNTDDAAERKLLAARLRSLGQTIVARASLLETGTTDPSFVEELRALLPRVEAAVNDIPADAKGRRKRARELLVAFCSVYRGRGDLSQKAPNGEIGTLAKQAAGLVASAIGDRLPELREQAVKAEPEIAALVSAYSVLPNVERGRPGQDLIERIAEIVGSPDVDKAIKRACKAMGLQPASEASIERGRYRDAKK
jgi:hypothetical protein